MPIPADPSSQHGVRPLLTIAVPTFNRSRFLSTFLAALQPQLQGEARVELLVSDNASPDETPEIVNQYCSAGCPILYIRNDVNIGADLNILQCFEKASGKFVWICGDDDVIEPGGLAVALRHLQSAPDLDLVSLQARGFHGAYEPQPVQLPERTISFTSPQDLASHVNVFFTFISGMIVNKERVISLPHGSFRDLAMTNLVQLGWTYTALEHHRRSLLIQTPIIATLADNTGGYSLFRVFGTNLKRVTVENISSKRVRDVIFRGALLSFFPWFLLNNERSARFVNDGAENILRKEFGNYSYFWLFNYPIIKLPPALGRVWLFGVRALNRIDRLFGRPLLRLPLP